MSGSCVLAAILAMAEIKALELALNFEANLAAQAGARIRITHLTYPRSVICHVNVASKPRWQRSDRSGRANQDGSPAASKDGSTAARTITAWPPILVGSSSSAMPYTAGRPAGRGN
jgi:hypothetical protein